MLLIETEKLADILYQKSWWMNRVSLIHFPDCGDQVPHLHDISLLEKADYNLITQANVNALNSLVATSFDGGQQPSPGTAAQKIILM